LDAINLNDVILFTYSSFTLLMMLSM